MSGVLSMAPRFGVSSDFCHGIGLFHMGMPLRISSAEARPTGAKTMTSYFARRSCLIRDGLRADVIEGHARGIEGIAPPAFGLSAKPGVHEGDARSGDRVDRHGRRCAESRCVER